MHSEIPLSGITAVLGRSGSGKTSLLRFLSGLDQPKFGEIQFADEFWQDQKHFLKTSLRQCGFVFQEPSLFPHLDVQGNLKFGFDSKQSKISFDEVIQSLQLDKLLYYQVQQLSGGQKQRVAIGRTLLANPKIIFMDEPLSSLDIEAKKGIIPFLLKVATKYKIPIVYVSHSLEEIYKLADHILIVESGKIIKSGFIKDVLSNLDVNTNFLSKIGESASIIEAQIINYSSKYNMFELMTDEQRIYVFAGDLNPRQDSDINSNTKIMIRPQDVSLNREKPERSSILNLLLTKVIDFREGENKTVLIKLQLNHQVILSQISLQSFEHLQITRGEKIWAQIKAVSLVN